MLNFFWYGGRLWYKGVFGVQVRGIGDDDDRQHGEGVDGNGKEKVAQAGGDQHLDGGGVGLHDRVECLDEVARGDATQRVVEDDDEHEGAGEDSNVKQTLDNVFVVGEHHHKQIASNRVDVHAQVLYHYVHILLFALQQVLVVDAREAGTKDLHEHQCYYKQMQQQQQHLPTCTNTKRRYPLKMLRPVPDPWPPKFSNSLMMQPRVRSRSEIHWMRLRYFLKMS